MQIFSIENILLIILIFLALFSLYRQIIISSKLSDSSINTQSLISEQRILPEKINALSNSFSDLQVKLLSQLHQDSARSMTELNQQLNQNLKLNSDLISKSVQNLTDQTRQSLKDINSMVETNLNKNFQKTNETFTDIVKRLTLIDQAQMKISELSTQVIDLQNLLTDKRARGAWGEVQLETLLSNLFPQNHYELQHTLSNGRRVDCMLFLPEPTGNIPIDAKFPLETYRKLQGDGQSDPIIKKKLEQQFKLDIKKHIDDIANRYILPPETSQGVAMFIPAEAIFSDIHSHYPELIDYSQKRHVWLVSPTTLMAVLTTAKAVIKDEATRKQVHVIKEHLIALSQDFERFEKRMGNLTRHIGMANQDAQDVNTSCRKITSRFMKIEKAELAELEDSSDSE